MSRDQRRPEAASALEAMTGHRMPGGCDDCAAYQTVERVDGALYVLHVHHDETCPTLREVRS